MLSPEAAKLADSAGYDGWLSYLFMLAMIAG
jgi:hypothetical protein